MRTAVMCLKGIICQYVNRNCLVNTTVLYVIYSVLYQPKTPGEGPSSRGQTPETRDLREGSTSSSRRRRRSTSKDTMASGERRQRSKLDADGELGLVCCHVFTLFNRDGITVFFYLYTLLKANFFEISSNTHQLHYFPLYHIIIIFDTVLRQKRNIEHKK